MVAVKIDGIHQKVGDEVVRDGRLYGVLSKSNLEPFYEHCKYAAKPNMAGSKALVGIYCIEEKVLVYYCHVK